MEIVPLLKMSVEHINMASGSLLAANPLKQNVLGAWLVGHGACALDGLM
jgi:hypothetical protein